MLLLICPLLLVKRNIQLFMSGTFKSQITHTHTGKLKKGRGLGSVIWDIGCKKLNNSIFHTVRWEGGTFCGNPPPPFSISALGIQTVFSNSLATLAKIMRDLRAPPAQQTCLLLATFSPKSTVRGFQRQSGPIFDTLCACENFVHFCRPDGRAAA